jgi:choline dehydrogenase
MSQYGIPTVVKLPQVGENLQDQPNTNFVLYANDTLNGIVPYVSFGSLADISLPLPSSSILSTWATAVASANAINGDSPISASSLTALFKIQYALLKASVPDAEVLLESSATIGIGPSPLLVAAFWLLMPFSRGSVHINSATPGAYPSIDPKFFLVDYDLQVQIAIAKWTRKFFATAPMASIVLAEVSPGFANVPANATDAQWEGFIKSTC